MSLAELPDTKMLFVLDEDDESDYGSLPVLRIASEGGGMGPPLNAAARLYWDDHAILGFIGDDHRVRTRGWDVVVTEHLTKPGMVYGNDLARQDIPTQVFISSAIVKALGWMALPGAKHLYLDDTWATIGNETGCLRYVPDLVIEHAHAFYGKAAMDAGYARVNAPAVYDHDHGVYLAWRASKMNEDLERVRAALRA